jgi:hypothetical protein
VFGKLRELYADILNEANYRGSAGLGPSSGAAGGALTPALLDAALAPSGHRGGDTLANHLAPAGVFAPLAGQPLNGDTLDATFSGLDQAWLTALAAGFPGQPRSS